MNRKTGILYLLIICALGACREQGEEINAPDRYLGISYSSQFESFWTGMNNNYMFWATEPTDWIGAYTKYKPLFKELDNLSKTDRTGAVEEKAHRYFEEMTSTLIDGHLAISFDDGSPTIQPASGRIKLRKDYHSGIPDRYFSQFISKKYLDQGVLNAPMVFGEDTLGSLLVGRVQKNILYLRIPAFYVNQGYQDDEAIKQAMDSFMLSIKAGDIKGIIIDVRSNGGGAARDLNFLVGSLIDKPLVFGKFRYKQGLGRLDYTPWMDATVKPNAQGVPFSKPVIVLTDVWSASMSELLAMAISSLPSGKGASVGERTFGAQGAIIGTREITNAGSFSFAGGKVRSAALMFRYRDGNIYEGIGFPPKEEVYHSESFSKTGKDLQLERALTLF